MPGGRKLAAFFGTKLLAAISACDVGSPPVRRLLDCQQQQILDQSLVASIRIGPCANVQEDVTATAVGGRVRECRTSRSFGSLSFWLRPPTGPGSRGDA